MYKNEKKQRIRIKTANRRHRKTGQEQADSFI